jgi:hypothetical protein
VGRFLFILRNKLGGTFAAKIGIRRILKLTFGAFHTCFSLKSYGKRIPTHKKNNQTCDKMESISICLKSSSISFFFEGPLITNVYPF